MGLMEIVMLWGMMALLAAIPSASVALVVSLATARGTRNGLAAVLGIVLADFVWIAIALLGVSQLTSEFGSLTWLIRCGAGLYLMYLGVRLYLTPKKDIQLEKERSPKPLKSLWGSILAGFLLTMADVKALLFYASLLPAFINVKTLDGADVLILVLIVIASVGGMKAIYAWGAGKVVTQIQKPCILQILNVLASFGLFMAGGFLLVATLFW